MGKKKLWIYITWMWYFASAQGPNPSSMLCWFHACFQRHFQAPPWWHHCGKYLSQCTFTSWCDFCCYITSHLNSFYWHISGNSSWDGTGRWAALPFLPRAKWDMEFPRNWWFPMLWQGIYIYVFFSFSFLYSFIYNCFRLCLAKFLDERRGEN